MYACFSELSIVLIPHLRQMSVISPCRGLVADSNHSSAATPRNVAYDSLKMALDGMANMTDGLPWPLKALPQTLMQLIQQAEVRDISSPSPDPASLK